MGNPEIDKIPTDLSLTKKPKWEILVSSKLDDYGVKKEFHSVIIEKIGQLLPFCLIMSFILITMIFGKKEK